MSGWLLCSNVPKIVTLLFRVVVNSSFYPPIDSDQSSTSRVAMTVVLVVDNLIFIRHQNKKSMSRVADPSCIHRSY